MQQKAAQKAVLWQGRQEGQSAPLSLRDRADNEPDERITAQAVEKISSNDEFSQLAGLQGLNPQPP